MIFHIDCRRVKAGVDFMITNILHWVSGKRMSVKKKFISFLTDNFVLEGEHQCSEKSDVKTFWYSL